MYMVRNQARSNRKASGARYKKQLVRRQHERDREPALTRVDATRRQTIRTIGGNQKTRLLRDNVAHVVDPATGKHQTVKILSVKQNPANRHFVRRNIMTKGTVIETENGDARITSRPGQDGAVQAILLG